MGLHLLAFNASIATATTAEVTAVTDDIWSIQTGRFMAPGPFLLRSAYFQSTTLNRVQFITPRLEALGRDIIRPINRGTTIPSLAGYDRLQNLNYVTKFAEMLYFQASHGGAGSETVTGFMAVDDRVDQPRPAVPMGNRFKVYGTSTTAAVANTWTTLTTSWNRDLPPGMYAVTGGTIIGASDLAFRIIPPIGSTRPGWLACNNAGILETDLAYGGQWGEWCRFTGETYPNIQVYCSTTTAAHEVVLELVPLSGQMV